MRATSDSPFPTSEGFSRTLIKLVGGADQTRSRSLIFWRSVQPSPAAEWSRRWAQSRSVEITRICIDLFEVIWCSSGSPVRFPHSSPTHKLGRPGDVRYFLLFHKEFLLFYLRYFWYFICYNIKFSRNCWYKLFLVTKYYSYEEIIKTVVLYLSDRKGLIMILIILINVKVRGNFELKLQILLKNPQENY